MTLRISGDIKFKKDPVLADPYYHNVSLLLHGDGANGSTTILDSSLSSHTITVISDTQISTAQSKYGGSSIVFDGVNDYCRAPNAAFVQDNTTPFTIELWAYWTKSTGIQQALVSTYGGSAIGFALQNSKAGILSVNLSGDGIDISGVSVTTGQWYHIALSGTPGSPGMKLFIDGVQTGSTYTGAVNLTNTSTALRIGYLGVGSTYFGGYIDDLRITKGVARYTSNFTPPTAPFPEVIG